MKIEAAAGVLLTLLSSHLWAQTSVRCSDPPGPSGTVHCESGQTPLCEAQGGSFVAYCIRQSATREQQARDLLRIILGSEPTAELIQEFAPQLEAGTVERRGRVFTFPGVERIDPHVGSPDPPTGLVQDENQVLQAPTPEKAPAKVRCTACLVMNGQEHCEFADGDTKDDASINALGKLYLELGKQFESGSIDMNASRVSCESGTR